MRQSILLLIILLITNYAKCETHITVPVNRTEVYNHHESINNVGIRNHSIADVTTHGNKRISVKGKKIGETDIIINGEAAISIKVIAEDMPSIRKTINNLFPDENIGIHYMGGNVVLKGYVNDEQISQQISTAAERLAPESGKVLNLIRLADNQQVMLRVKVGEIRRDTVNALGIGGDIKKNHGKFTGSALSNVASIADNFTTASLMYNALSGTMLHFALDALQEKGMLKVLAEPNLVAISGEKATFHAGGELANVVRQNNTNTMEYKPVGVGVSFTPKVLPGGRIRIYVEPEVSETADRHTATNPANITVRRASTTVELAPGESFMIAGLIKNEAKVKLKQTPGISAIPFLGSLLRKSEYKDEETELVIAITPYMVDPLPIGDKVILPTDHYHAPGVMDALFMGSIGRYANTGSQNPIVEGNHGYILE